MGIFTKMFVYRNQYFLLLYKLVINSYSQFPAEFSRLYCWTYNFSVLALFVKEPSHKSHVGQQLSYRYIPLQKMSKENVLYYVTRYCF